MNTWIMFDTLYKRATATKIFMPQFSAFKVETKEGDKVGHNSHYRSIWVSKWWEALYGKELMGKDFVLKNPTKDRYHAHQALDVALEDGPQAVIEYMWKTAYGEINDDSRS